MKNRKLIAVFATLFIGSIFSVPYFSGFWAPTSFEGGLQLPDTIELIDSRGNVLPEKATQEFVRICSELRSTTRDIGEDKGDGFVKLRDRGTDDTDFLTIYPSMRVVFHGWWIDAKTFSMLDRRAPCFELSADLEQFIRENGLLSITAE